MQTVRIAGSLLRRPSATSTAIGKARKIDSVASITVSGRPPQQVGPHRRQAQHAAAHSTKKTASTATHIAASQGFQKVRMQLTTSAATSSDGGDLGPPLLVERVAAEDDQRGTSRRSRPSRRPCRARPGRRRRWGRTRPGTSPSAPAHGSRQSASATSSTVVDRAAASRRTGCGVTQGTKPSVRPAPGAARSG